MTEVPRDSEVRWRLLAAVTVLAALFVGLLCLQPTLSRSSPAAGWLADEVCATVCHQKPERSLHAFGGQIPVCARCFGLYLGGWVGLFIATLLAWRGRRPAVSRLVLLLAVPTALDALLVLTIGGGLANVPRLLISLPAGAALGLLLGEGVEELERSVSRR